MCSLPVILRKNFCASLVSYISNQIVGAKFLSNQKSFKRFFYNVRVVNLITKENAALVLQEFSIFGQKARISTKKSDHCVNKLLKIYDKWKRLQKNLIRTTGEKNV